MSLVATQKIAPLQNTVDIDEATVEEETKLKEWKSIVYCLIE